MKNQRQNISYSSNIIKNNSSILSPSVETNYLNPIEECSENDDIIKKLDNLTFSSDEKSFESSFFSFSKTKNKNNSQSNKSISIPNLINDKNIDNFPFELKTIKEEDITSDYNSINNILENKTKTIKFEKNSEIYCLLLKEKINRICNIIQNYNINHKCHYIMNNFINYINDINNNLYKPIDSVLDVIIELLSKIKGEYAIKEGLTDKLNNMSLNKEDYEKKIIEIKKELIYKEKEIELLKSRKNSHKKKEKDNSNEKIIFEINNIKKENQFLFEKNINYKTQIKKVCSEYKILHDKYKICLKDLNSNGVKEKSNILKQEKIFDFSLNNISSSSKKTINTEAISPIKKLACDLISFLLDINKMLFKYDFALVKMNKMNNFKTPLNDVNDLNHNIDINYLLIERNYAIFSKYLFCNMDIIYNKIINVNKGNSTKYTYSNNKNINESKRIKGEKKKVNSKIISLNNSRINQTINLYVPESNSCAKNLKSYISIKKNRGKEKYKKMVRNSTSRNGFSFLNFYSDTDLENNLIIKKDMNNNKNKKIGCIANLDKNKKPQNNNDKINGDKKTE